MNAAEIISKILPVVLLMLTGNLLCRFHFFKPGAVGEIKKFLINITVPCLLFTAYAKTVFESRYLLIIAAMFFLCLLLLPVGFLMKKTLGLKNKYYPILLTGFETGMVGFSLFISVFGNGNLFKIAVIDLGNSLFINIILVCFIRCLNGNAVTPKGILRSILQTPPIMAIFVGILFSVTGIYGPLTQNPFSNALLSMISEVSNITVPGICMVIGYELYINLKNIRIPLITCLVRMTLGMSAGLLINVFLFEHLLHLDRLFSIALFTMLMLPPSFGMPMYIREDAAEDRQLIVNTTSLNILLTIPAFLILNLIFSH